MHEERYCVYVMTNPRNTVLYTGVTGNLPKRVWQHKEKLADGFTKKYNCIKLVYFEQTSDVMSAIEREKQIKKYRREKKIKLIESMNPQWNDLFEQISQ